MPRTSMARSTGSTAAAGTGRGKRASARAKQEPAKARRGASCYDLLSRGPSTSVARGEALTELKQLFEVLSSSEQRDEEVQRKLSGQVQALAADELVRHPERDVRLWTAKCLAEAIRIYAPEAPYKDAKQLRDINVLFIEQLGTLTDPELFDDGLRLLERLNEVCGFMLIFDSENSSQLLVELVETCIKAARGSNSESLELPLFQVLSSVLGEADDVPKSVWVTLVEMLTSRGRASERAMGLARRILGRLANQSAAAPINDFLNAALYAPPEDVSQLMHASEAFHQRDELLRATVELYRIDPALVGRVIPNLQTDLQCNDPDRREAITKSVGQMLAHCHEGSQSMLMTANPLLFEKFLERLGDVSEGVRLVAVDGVEAILAAAVASSEKKERTVVAVNAGRSIGEELQNRCLDPCEEVRRRVVQVAANVAKSDMGFQLLEPVLPDIFRRIFDKKAPVREECVDGLAHLYSQHALPAWAEGRKADADRLAFVPQLLCEAYHVFALNRHGRTEQIEACLEEHVLGCGLGADQRALALAGLLSSVAGCEASEKGLYQLLARKRDGHNALRNFLSLRLRGTPVLSPAPAVQTAASVPAVAAEGALAASSGEAASDGAAAARSVDKEAALAVEALARVNPVMEDRSGRLENHLSDLKRLDLVRDRALWKALDELINPSQSLTTANTGSHMAELDEIIRRKGLEDLRPLLRRCLLTSWLLSDQVSSLLKVWGAIPTDGKPSEMSDVVQRAVEELPKYFPEPFLPHVATIADHLQDASIDSVHAALRALASLGKYHTVTYVALGSTSSISTLPDDLSVHLLDAVLRLCAAESICGDASAICRKAMRTLGLLQPEAAWASMAKFLDWATEHSDRHRSIALRLMSACIDWSSGVHGCPAALRERAADNKEWIATARNALHGASSGIDLTVQRAAVELLASAGDAAELAAVFDSSVLASIRLHASVSALRAIRRGQLQLSTSLLQHIAKETLAALVPERVDEISVLTSALQKLLKPITAMPDSEQGAAMRLKLSGRLRLCATLPALFAQAPEKRHRDSALRIMQSSIAKAVRQSRLQQQPMIDFAVACFIHFLARVPAFIEEANSAVSAYPESTRIASFFVEALLRADQPKGSELAAIVLRVTERVGHFIDKEDPTSDKVHRAAYVLKYVVEKRRPELGAIDKTLQGAPCGCMPRELFEIGQVAPVNLSLQSGQRGDPASPDTPARSEREEDDVLTQKAIELQPTLQNAAASMSGDQLQKEEEPSEVGDKLPSPKQPRLMSSFHAASAGPSSRKSVSAREALSTPGCASSLAPRRLSYSSTRHAAGSDGRGQLDDGPSPEAKRRRMDSPEP